MEVGKKYRVVYKDGQGTERVKELIFVKRDGVLLVFNNPYKRENAEEIVNEIVIIRIEELQR